MTSECDELVTVYARFLFDFQQNMTFSQRYNDVLNSTKNRTNTAPYVYDAIWTMANILERARPVLEKKGKVLHNLSYGEETELLEKLAYETDFNGATVRTTNEILIELSILQHCCIL